MITKLQSKMLTVGLVLFVMAIPIVLTCMIDCYLTEKAYHRAAVENLKLRNFNEKMEILDKSEVDEFTDSLRTTLGIPKSSYPLRIQKGQMMQYPQTNPIE